MYPEGPHFSIVFYTTVLGLVASTCSLIGVCTYQNFLKNCKYVQLIFFINVLVAILNCADIILYSRLNVKFGIPDKVFLLGSTAIQTTVHQWMWLPGVVILSQLCPKYMEATMFALLAGCHNLGNTAANCFGALVLHEMGVDPSGMNAESEKFKNLWKCSVISSSCPLLTLILLPYLIPDARQTDKLLVEGEESATSGSLWRRWMERGREAGGAPL